MYREGLETGNVETPAPICQWYCAKDFWCDETCFCRSCGPNNDGGLCNLHDCWWVESDDCTRCVESVDPNPYIWMCDSTGHVLDTTLNLVLFPVMIALQGVALVVVMCSCDNST